MTREPSQRRSTCQTSPSHLFRLPLPANASRRHASRRKWKLYERVQELHATGMSLRKIGEELGLARNTVRKYFRQVPDPPLPTPRPLRASQLDPYEDYLLQRWSQGERNAAQLYRERSRAWISREYVDGKSLRGPFAHDHSGWLSPSLTQGACQGHLATCITLAAGTQT